MEFLGNRDWGLGTGDWDKVDKVDSISNSRYPMPHAQFPIPIPEIRR
ncbi:hypothetical protein [Nostoc sp. CMAA1605]|nr:hypothetical protein [Nostoc sp. CMAA1605]